jgi:nucleotide-binding universal stress UspA family protein
MSRRFSCGPRPKRALRRAARSFPCSGRPNFDQPRQRVPTRYGRFSTAGCQARTEQAGIKAEWIDIDGIAELVVEERGARADFLVVEQPARHDYGTSWNALRAALLATGRPVLVVPANSLSEFGRRVAIAWRDDERATKAVLAGLRCLACAERVFLLAGVRNNAAPAMPAILSEHAVSVELHALPIGSGAFGAVLLAKAHDLGADMLMMGAYAHSPLRQLLFGGVTRYMLSHADIPVLMRH